MTTLIVPTNRLLPLATWRRSGNLRVLPRSRLPHFSRARDVDDAAVGPPWRRGSRPLSPRRYARRTASRGARASAPVARPSSPRGARSRRVVVVVVSSMPPPPPLPATIPPPRATIPPPPRRLATRPPARSATWTACSAAPPTPTRMMTPAPSTTTSGTPRRCSRRRSRCRSSGCPPRTRRARTPLAPVRGWCSSRRRCAAPPRRLPPAPSSRSVRAPRRSTSSTARRGRSANAACAGGARFRARGLLHDQLHRPQRRVRPRRHNRRPEPRGRGRDRRSAERRAGDAPGRVCPHQTGWRVLRGLSAAIRPVPAPGVAGVLGRSFMDCFDAVAFDWREGAGDPNAGVTVYQRYDFENAKHPVMGDRGFTREDVVTATPRELACGLSACEVGRGRGPRVPALIDTRAEDDPQHRRRAARGRVRRGRGARGNIDVLRIRVRRRPAGSSDNRAGEDVPARAGGAFRRRRRLRRCDEPEAALCRATQMVVGAGGVPVRLERVGASGLVRARGARGGRARAGPRGARVDVGEILVGEHAAFRTGWG